MAEHNELGEEGEKIAQEHLLSLGYKILETNWRKGKMEVDIIAQQQDYLVLIEVKTRSSDQFGHPEAFVDGKKQMMMAEAAENYIYDKQLTDINVRYDILSLVISSNHCSVLHIQDAFYPDNLNIGKVYF